ncbi:MAG: chromosome segregation protein SMC [Patescibacteria group bacterium]|nr:chromosome segregation protein SMC [Patescibacteria group bacterium]
MYLKRLEIHGFKSFAQKTALEFSQGIIAVVGPNGSGKSNVADAIRWVLGEQSPKLIRGKKSEDVIFAGSDKKTRLGFAEVVATFDNRDRRIPVDAAEVSIGRRIDRSGESEYLLNGNRVRLLDIIDLVLKSNIGTSRYTVIGQGTIDQMILQGPAEVKNLLDEASGIKTYQIKREKTLRRLEQTANNLMRAEDLINEIEPRLKSLRRQAKKMEARAQLETDLKILQQEFYGKSYWNLKTALDSFQQRLALLQEERARQEEIIQRERQRLENMEAQSNGASGKYKDLQDRLNKFQSQKNKLLEDLSLVRGKMQSQKTANVGDARTLQVELHNKERQILEVGEKIGAAQNNFNQAGRELQQQRQALQQITQKLDKLYASSKNPVQIDWSLFDLELEALDKVFLEFQTQVQQSQDIGQVKSLVENLQQGFIRFKSVAKETVRNPEAALAAFQRELEGVLKQKEEADKLAAGLDIKASKEKIQLEFLEKELQKLQQEKLHLELELKKAQSSSIDEFWQSLVAEEYRIKAEVETQAKEVAALEDSLKSYYDEETAKQKVIHQSENQLRAQQDQLSKTKDQQSQLQVEKAKYDTQMDILREEALRVLGAGIWELLQKERPAGQTEGLEEKILRLKNQLEMIGGMDELTLKEYRETESRYTNLTAQVNDLKQGMTDLRNIIDELDVHIKQKFNEAFHKVNEKFENYFRLLFNGGRAYLSVLKEEAAAEEAAPEAGEEPADETEGEKLRPEEKIIQKYEQGGSHIIGVDIKATPPNKKLSSIQALSGGERALTSIALLCSLLTCFPSPFVVLDEVDAALDDANTIRFGQILSTLSHQTQFVTITHNRETMAQASILYGVTMGDDGVSKLLSVKLDQAKQYAK